MFVWKDENKQKEARDGPFLKKYEESSDLANPLKWTSTKKGKAIT